MKKTIIAAALLLLLPVLLFADFSYSLDLLSFEPLHQEYTADRDRAGFDFQWLYVDQFPTGVYQDCGGPKFFEFVSENQYTDGYDEAPWMALIHLGETLSMAKNTFTFDHWLSPIAFDFSLQGSMLLGMEGGMADMIGYDGVFFYGATASVADKVSMRFGLHHYCTHLGDGTIKMLGLDAVGPQPGIRLYKKYIRMEAFAFGLSVHPFDWIRTYAEVNWTSPLVTDAFDTLFFQPGWKDKTGYVQGKTDDFKSLIVNFGIELSYPIFEKLGKTTLSYDCHAYEEGQIVYKVEDMANRPDWVDPDSKAYYDPSLPWEFEHELVLSQEIGASASIEIGYHHGRFPLNSFYHQRCNYGYVGMRINPDLTVNIVDTAR